MLSLYRVGSVVLALAAINSSSTVISSMVSAGLFMVFSSDIDDSQEVAAVAGFPLVVLLAQDCPGEAQERGAVREHADDVGAAFDLLVDPFQRVRGPDLSAVALRKAANASKSCSASATIAETFGWERASKVITSVNCW